MQFVDQDKNGIINGDDRVVLGSIQPDFIYGFSGYLRYHNLDASVTFQGSHGNKVFNSLRRILENSNDAYNVLSSYYTAPKTNSYIDSRYIEDASYLKLRNLTVGYKIPLRNFPISVRLFVTAQNLFTITNYKGYDPEVASGVDTGAYPVARTFIFGVDVKL